jgi:hypothetical protein
VLVGMLGSSHHREESPASAARERDRFAVDGGEPSVCLVARFLLLDVADNVQESRTRRVPTRFAGRGPLWSMYRIMSPYYARRAEVLESASPQGAGTYRDVPIRCSRRAVPA